MSSFRMKYSLGFFPLPSSDRPISAEILCSTGLHNPTSDSVLLSFPKGGKNPKLYFGKNSVWITYKHSEWEAYIFGRQGCLFNTD